MSEVFNITKPEDMKWYLNGKPLDDVAQTAIELAEENTRLKAENKILETLIREHCKTCNKYILKDKNWCAFCDLQMFKEDKK